MQGSWPGAGNLTGPEVGGTANTWIASSKQPMVTSRSPLTPGIHPPPQTTAAGGRLSMMDRLDMAELIVAMALECPLIHIERRTKAFLLLQRARATRTDCRAARTGAPISYSEPWRHTQRQPTSP